MARALYLEDSYLKEFDAEVSEVKDGKYVVLSNTAFYPTSGGQPYDTGTMTCGDQEYKVVFCGKFSGKISHEVDKPGLKAGDKVHCKIDWDRRYKLMRQHTAAHVLAGALHRATQAIITGGQLDVEKSRIDFSLESYNPEEIQNYISKANEVVQQDLPVTAEFMTREEAMKIPGVSKLAMGLPESIKDVRVLSIGDFDVQADGGTHVKSTKEIGKIEYLKSENKGKGRKRIYYTVK